MINQAQPGGQYPAGQDMQSQITRRQRWGLIWRYGFLAAALLAIIVLLILLVTIINQSFGLVAVQNVIPPESLVLNYREEQMLSADNVLAGEDDQVLAEGIAGQASGVGFFGFAYYAANADDLKLLAVEGVTPSAETAANDTYPLARPLYIYTTADILAQKPQVAAFVDYYLAHANEVVEAVGYFPAGGEAMTQAEATVAAAQGLDSLPAVDPADFGGAITAAGSSTVFPVTTLMGERFQADGFTGVVNVESVGTRAGFNSFCFEAGTDVDLVNASRPINQLEHEACRANGREPIEIRIGTDALAVVANPANSQVSNVTMAELQQLFTTAGTWSEVNDSWPAEPVYRFIPSSDSGTLDFFVETVFEERLEDLPKEALVALLAENISPNVGRRLEREQRFFADVLVFEDPALWAELCAAEDAPAGCTGEPRSQQDVYLLVQERVVQPSIQQSWYLWPSLTQRAAIVRETALNFPSAELEFRSWLSRQYLSSPQSSVPELAGVRTAILGSLWVIVITILVAFPLGVSAAIYLEEYADQRKWHNRLIQTNINNLAGVPSIIYGMLGLAVFVRALEPLTSGAIFGVVEAGATANGRTILSAGLTLALLILPIIIISSQEAIRAVPNSLRQAGLALGATKWQTIWSHVLPNALPGILTGAILSMSRAVGETAPLVVIGASTFITADPTGPFSKFTVLPIQIYQWTTRPQDIFRNLAGAAIIVLLVLLLTLNATAVLLRNRYSKRMG